MLILIYSQHLNHIRKKKYLSIFIDNGKHERKINFIEYFVSLFDSSAMDWLKVNKNIKKNLSEQWDNLIFKQNQNSLFIL